jgi:hypothetical protein
MCPICLSGLVIALGSAGAVGGVGVAVAKRWSGGSRAGDRQPEHLDPESPATDRASCPGRTRNWVSDAGS